MLTPPTPWFDLLVLLGKLSMISILLIGILLTPRDTERLG